MPSIHRCDLPRGALLQKYEQDGAYADCYSIDVAHRVSHAEFVEAFYTTALFRIERLLLSWFAARPSSDIDATHFAIRRTRDSFAAWDVEAHHPHELLMTDYLGRTRSWFMVAPAQSGAAQNTRLYFGSAVVPSARAGSGARTVGVTFRLLLGFHQLYSRALLSAATSRLARARTHP